MFTVSILKGMTKSREICKTYSCTQYTYSVVRSTWTFFLQKYEIFDKFVPCWRTRSTSNSFRQNTCDFLYTSVGRGMLLFLKRVPFIFILLLKHHTERQTPYLIARPSMFNFSTVLDTEDGINIYSSKKFEQFNAIEIHFVCSYSKNLRC